MEKNWNLYFFPMGLLKGFTLPATDICSLCDIVFEAAGIGWILVEQRII